MRCVDCLFSSLLFSSLLFSSLIVSITSHLVALDAFAKTRLLCDTIKLRLQGTEGGLKAKLLLFRDLRGMALRSLMRGEFDIKTETANTGNSKRDKRIRKMRSILARKRLKAMVKFVGHQALMEKRSSQKLQGIESEEVSEELHKLREIKAKMKSDEEMNADAKGTGKGEVDKKLGALAFEDGGDADGDDGDEGPNNPFEVPEEFDSEFVLWLLCLPVSVPCYLTIPNCGWGGKWKPYYLATFFISLIWISVFAFGKLLLGRSL